MSDTQRTRAQILQLFADNVTGQITAQNLRDYTVTVMEPEFKYPGDFWKQPSARATTTDATGRGWKKYSQVLNSACSFGNILAMDSDGGWVRADVADSTKTGILGVALNSFASDADNGEILMEGMVYFSGYSALFSGFIGRPVYLASGDAGGITVTPTTNSQLVIAWVEASDDGGVAIGKYRFTGHWAVKGE
jgi:hypothetical protein